MDYQLQFRKFISSQYLYMGLRVTAGVLIPAYLLYRYGLLISMISLPLGALFISLTDTPGPISARRNGMLVSLALCFCVLIISGYSRGSHALIMIEIIVFGLLFSLIAVFGNRANSIGLIVLLVFILNIDAHQNQDVFRQAAYFVAGGAWYALLSLVLYTIRPYKPIQQLLGECLMEIAGYLQTKRLFYEKQRDLSTIYQQLMQYQVKIQNHQNELREMLFTTRRYFSESTVKGRLLMMMFLDSIDLQESIMTSQQDYELLHKEFDDTGIIEQFNDNIRTLANELHNIGLAIQSGYVYRQGSDLDMALEESKKAFFELREKQLSSANVEGFIKLRHILYSLQDITERIKRLGIYTTYDKNLSKQYKSQVELEKFIPQQEVSRQLFIDSISLKSANFRHALRLTAGLLTGYIISLLFPLGHGYWILLTIAVIVKPAYGITRQRNIQRLLGTFAGVAIGFMVLYLTRNNGLIFILMIVAMIISYSFLKLNYAVSSAAITLYVILNFYFLSPGGLQHVLTDRMIDTVIGSVIAYLVSYFVLPAWEHEQMDDLIIHALESNKAYFDVVAGAYVGKVSDPTSFKIARKDAFVALGNLSDNFQRMLSEPKSRQPHLEEHHQFVAASHMLTSHIASLSYYAGRSATEYMQEDFLPMIRQIDKRFFQAIAVIQKNEPVESVSDSLPMNKKVQQLLEQRKKEIEIGIESDMQVNRKKLSEIKTITDQFQLIYGNLVELIKILQKLKAVSGK